MKNLNHKLFNINKIYILAFLVMLLACKSEKSYFEEMYLFVGTYTENTESKGIYLYKVNIKEKYSLVLQEIDNIPNPSFLCTDENKKFLFAVSEVDNYGGEYSGGVFSYSIEKENYKLTPLHHVSSMGAHPCHINFHSPSNQLFVSNYSSGNMSVIKVDEKGHLIEAQQVFQHTGKGKDTIRQMSPHVHSTIFSNDKKNAYAVDLGIDRIMNYKIENEKVTLHDSIVIGAGKGPRHFVIHPDLDYAYLINELGNTISVFSVNNDDNSLTFVEEISTLPNNFTGENYTADIHIHPNGKFLYGSNRGHNSISIFKINEENGKLMLLKNVSTMGNWPRNFTITPNGEFMIVANQKSNTLTFFKINPDNGDLNFIQFMIGVPSPVSLVVMN